MTFEDTINKALRNEFGDDDLGEAQRDLKYLEVEYRYSDPGDRCFPAWEITAGVYREAEPGSMMYFVDEFHAAGESFESAVSALILAVKSGDGERVEG